MNPISLLIGERYLRFVVRRDYHLRVNVWTSGSADQGIQLYENTEGLGEEDDEPNSFQIIGKRPRSSRSRRQSFSVNTPDGSKRSTGIPFAADIHTQVILNSWASNRVHGVEPKALSGSRWRGSRYGYGLVGEDGVEGPGLWIFCDDYQRDENYRDLVIAIHPFRAKTSFASGRK